MKIRKMTQSEFRKKLAGMNKAELEELLLKMYASCQEAGLYLNAAYGDPSFVPALSEEAKAEVRSAFFTKSGRGKLDTRIAKDAIKRYTGILPDVSILELRLCFVENAVDLANRYHNFPASFYRDIQTVFRPFAEELNQQSDLDAVISFRDRVDKVVRNAVGTEGGLHGMLKGMTEQIRWPDETAETETSLPAGIGEKVQEAGSGEEVRNTGSGETTTGLHPEDEAAQSQISSKATAGETLSPEDGALFYRLWRPLLDYVNEKYRVNDLRDIAGAESLDPMKVKEIANVLWKTPEIIDAYLTEKGSGLSEDEKGIIRGWKKAVTGRFVLERHLKKGSILISTGNSKVYLVRGIISSWEEMFPGYPMPLLIDATLIPFRDVIISDGLVYPLNVFMGRGIAKSFKDAYMTAKRGGGLIEEM